MRSEDSQESAAFQADLLERLEAGNPAAFPDLVHRFLPRVLAVAQAIVGRSGDAEDVAQEVFFKVHAKLSTFRRDSSLYTWIYRITVNTATDHVKRNRASGQTESLDTVTPAARGDSPLEALSRSELSLHVRDALSELPPPFRILLALREIEGLSYEEISRVSGLPFGTVASRLLRARARLKEILEARLGRTAPTSVGGVRCRLEPAIRRQRDSGRLSAGRDTGAEAGLAGSRRPNPPGFASSHRR